QKILSGKLDTQYGKRGVCPAPETPGAFHGWSGFLDGGSMSFAYAAGYALSNYPELQSTPYAANIEEKLRTLDYSPSDAHVPPCGFTGTFGQYIDHVSGQLLPAPKWKAGDTCMDEDVVAAEA